MAIYKLGGIHSRLEFVGVDILKTFCFFSIILASLESQDMLESQSRALKIRMMV